METAKDDFGASDMKTRILHTKIWEDEFFSGLGLNEKLLFIYYITNNRIGLTGIYEITDRVVSFDTGLKIEAIQRAKQVFQKAGKILFKGNWVNVVNSSKLSGYKGKKLSIAIEKEQDAIPDSVYQYFDTLYQNADTLSEIDDTPINHKSEIINNKSDRVVKGKFEEMDEAFLKHVAEKYDVPMAFVLSKRDDLENWIEEKPARGRGRDLKRTLMVWVKKDAMERRENAKSKIAYVGDPV